MKKKKVIVVMPAYNAAKTLKKTFDSIPKGIVDNFILVDDCSKDNTIQVAKSIKNIEVVQHKHNKGYGGNQKTCYDTALKHNPDVVVLLHPDYQYDPKKLPEIIRPILENKADIVYGSRMLIKGDAKKGGMPAYKRIGNHILTAFFNLMLHTHLTDAATGYIAYSRKVLDTIPYHKNHDGFEFDEEAIIQCAYFGFRIAEIPIPTKYEDDSSSISLSKSIKYGMSLFTKVMKYKLHKWKLIKYGLIIRTKP